MIRAISLFFAVAITGVTAFGFEVGETVIVVHDAKLDVNGHAVGRVWPGLDLKIEAIIGHQLWVSNSHPGWLNDEHVVELERGLPVLNEMIRQNPVDASLYAGRASVWKAIGEYDKAIADCDEAIRLDHTNILAYINRGTIRTIKGDVDKGLADFNDALLLDPMNVHALVGRGNAWNQRTIYDNATGKFNEAFRIGSKWTSTLMHIGNVWSLETEYDKALIEFNEIFQIETAFKIARRDYHSFRVRDRNREQWSLSVEIANSHALADYNEAIRLDPEFVTAYVSRGIAWENLGGSDAAIKDFTHAIMLDPRCAEAYERRGHARRVNSNSEEAYEDLNEAIRLDPSLIVAYLKRAHPWDLIEHYELTGVDSTDSIWLDSKLTNEFERSESTRKRKAELANARSDFEADRLKRGHIIDRYFYGHSWEKISQYGKSAREVSQVRELVPTFDLNYYNRRSERRSSSESPKMFCDSDRTNDCDLKAFTEFSDDRLGGCMNRACDEAIIKFLGAIGFDQKNPDVYDRLAWFEATCSHEMLRNGQLAVSNATKACELTSWKDAHYLGTLAAAYAEAGHWKNAIERQEQAIELASDEPSRETGRQRLELYKTRKPFREDPNVTK